MNRYNSQFGCDPDNYTQGCIGIVKDVCGKLDLSVGTDCFSFKGDIAKTLAAASNALASKKCAPCHHPIMFAYNYWTNGKGAGGCPHCGHVANPIIPPWPVPSATGIPYDFCVRMFDEQWLGGNHGHSKPTRKYWFGRIWKNWECVRKLRYACGVCYLHGG